MISGIDTTIVQIGAGALILCAVVIGGFATRDDVVAWIARRRRHAETIRADLHLKKRLPLSTFGSAATFAIVVILGFWAGMPLVGIVAGVIGYRLVEGWPEVLRRKRMAQFDQQLPDAMTSLSNALRAGKALGPAIEQVAKDCKPPISQEFARMAEEHRLGSTIEDALESARQRLGRPEFDLCVTAFRLGKAQGGDIAKVFDHLAGAVREIRRLEEHVKTVSTQGRSSARFMSFMPAVFLGLLFMMDADATKLLFTDPVGNVILCVVITFNVIGHLWIKRILTFDI